MAKDVKSASGEEEVKKSSEAEADVRKKKKATNDNIEISNFEQYILNQNLDKIGNYFLSNRDLFNYRTFRQINGDGAQIVNKLRGIDNLDVFYRIKTSTLSLMRPKIRIYKVNYEEFVEAEDSTVDQGKVVSLPQPCYREFKFSDNFGKETAASVQDYLSYESTRPHWRNVGLKSFTVQQDGERHGVVENNIDCKLVLTFKSLKDLQAQPPGEPAPEKGGLRYVDLFMWSPARIDRETDMYNPKHYEIKVLLGYTAPSKDQLRGLNLTERDINAIANIEKLNTVLSLSLYNYDLNIADDGQVELVASYRGRIETTIGTNQVNIFQNTFRLSKDGAVDISRKVNADHNISNVFSLQTKLRSIHRGLRATSCKDEKCEARKNLRSLVTTDAFFGAMAKEAFQLNGKIDPSTGLMDAGSDALKIKGDGTTTFSFFKEGENNDKLHAVIKQKVGLFKKDVYKTFVDQLIDGNNEPDSPGTRLFCLAAGQKDVQGAMGVVVDKPGPGITEADERTISAEDHDTSKTTAMPVGDPGVRIGRCHNVEPLDPDIKSKVASEIATSIDGESASKDKTTSSKDDPARKASIQDFSGENYKFYFVYLGDIVELACKNAGLGKLDLTSDPNIENRGFSVFPENTYFPKDEQNGSTNYPLKNARVLLGPLEYIDNNGDTKVVNLAQFPISFNLFRSWFLKKVVRRTRPQMPLGSFITALINNLVMPALGAGMPRTFRPPKTRSSMVSLTLPGKTATTGGIERKSCGASIGTFKEALPQQQVINIDSAEFKEDYFSFVKDSVAASETLIKTSYDYLLIYVTTHKNIIERRGDPAEDVKDGIYHFNIGSDMGLLKNMKFSRVPVPMLAELRSKQAEEQGVDSLEQLKFPYDTDLTLIGTSLFTPGMFYYVNPSLAGLGSVEDAASLAYKMNLGGYHLIGKVTTKITQDNYETIIDGTQTSQGRR